MTLCYWSQDFSWLLTTTKSVWHSVILWSVPHAWNCGHWSTKFAYMCISSPLESLHGTVLKNFHELNIILLVEIWSTLFFRVPEWPRQENGFCQSPGSSFQQSQCARISAAAGSASVVRTLTLNSTLAFTNLSSASCTHWHTYDQQFRSASSCTDRLLQAMHKLMQKRSYIYIKYTIQWQVFNGRMHN